MNLGAQRSTRSTNSATTSGRIVSDYIDGPNVPSSAFADGEVDEEALATLTEFILNGGVNKLLPYDTTGEFTSLAPEQ